MHLLIWSRFCFLSLAAVAIASIACAEEPQSPPEEDTAAPAKKTESRLKPTREVIYKKVGDTELRLFVFEPPDFKPTDRRPCFLTIHGGGWGGGNPQMMFKYAYHFSKNEGMVGISLEYRKWNKKAGITVFDCVKDGRSAVRYIRAHAAELGIDPDKMIVNGGSAGGHIALGTALFDGVDDSTDDLKVSCIPNVLIPLYPVIDTSTEGYGNAKIGERWQELSPVLHVRAGLPPMLLFHCTGDKTCPFIGSKNFYEATIKAGNRCEFVVKEGGAHSAFSHDPELYKESLVKMHDFLVETGMIAKTSTPQ